MTVRYTTEEKAFVEEILTYYPFVIDKVDLLFSKDGLRRWAVETDQGPKVLKETLIRPERTLFLTEAHLHLQQNGLNMATIHPTTQGGICLGGGNASYALYDRIDGDEMSYYNITHMHQTMAYAGKFHEKSIGYLSRDESKTRSRLGKWKKLYSWKLQELQGNKQIALSFPDDPFSILFLSHVDEMLERGYQSLKSLDTSYYEDWTKQVTELGGFCMQDFTLAHFVEVNGEPLMKELHSITYDLPTRDIRILLNKLMTKLSVWDTDVAVSLLQSYHEALPRKKEEYEVLWNDIAFPYLFCAVAHKYYLKQKRSWSDEKYLWALQNVISVETSKKAFLDQFSQHVAQIQQQEGDDNDE